MERVEVFGLWFFSCHAQTAAWMVRTLVMAEISCLIISTKNLGSLDCCRKKRYIYIYYIPHRWHKHPKAHIHVLNSVILDPAQDVLQSADSAICFLEKNLPSRCSRWSPRWVDQAAVTVAGRRPRPRGAAMVQWIASNFQKMFLLHH